MDMSRTVVSNFTAVLVLCILAVSIHGISLYHDHVWDDQIVILKDPVVLGSFSDLLFSIDSGRSTDKTPYYRPLTLATFMIEGKLHRFTPVLMHGVNLILHALTTIFVFVLLRRLKVPPIPALISAGLFGVHPVTVETVSFLSGGRNTLLSALLVLFSTILYDSAVTRGKKPFLAGALLSYFAALMAKETALVLPAIFIWLEMNDKRTVVSSSSKTRVFRIALVVVVTIFYGMLRTSALDRAGVTLQFVQDPGRWLAATLFILPRYLLNLVWPAYLSPKYFIPDDLHLVSLALGGGWLVIVSLLIVLVRSRRAVTLLGLCWAFIFWLPTSGIVPIPSAPLADRYLYLPLIGVCLIIGDQTERFLCERPLRKWFLPATVSVILVLSGVSIRQGLFWRNDGTLFSRLVELYPDLAYGYHNLGCYYLDKRKDLDLAEDAFSKALARDPAFPRLQTQLGYVRFMRGDLAGALQHYALALEQNPADGEALVKRGEALELTGNKADALIMYKRFLALPTSDIPSARPVVEQRVQFLGQ